MKRFGICTAIAAVITLFTAASTHAQQNQQGNWQERMKAEKIAFITSELELTSKEAEAFWPVYNQCCQEKAELQKAVKLAYKNLSKATTEGTADEKELGKLLNEYLKAKQAQMNSCQKNVEKYRNVMPEGKVAKLYVAEEKFRRQQIRSMKCGQSQAPCGKPQAPCGKAPAQGRGGAGRGFGYRR